MDDLSTLTPARRWRWVAPLAVLLLCLTFFLAGMAVDHFLPAAPAAGGTETTGLDAALLDEARRVIQENFVDRDAATDEQLQTGALAGMVAVSYTQLTLPTSDLVEISVVAVFFKKKTKKTHTPAARHLMPISSY